MADVMHQRGGTVLGFVAGLVVGLGLALAVAVYVTKTPVPFVNKAPSRTAEQDAAEAKKNKDWDPNAPLYGKNPAKSTASTTTTTGTPTAAVSTPTGGTPSKADAKADPIAAKAAEKEARDAKADASKDPFVFFVQAGAFRTPEDAEAQRAKLTLQGLDAKVTERESAGRTVYRVRLGPFEKREEADKAKEKLDAAGSESAIVRVQR
jgi:cell division protein FtsN